jgi:hypothetical protein
VRERKHVMKKKDKVICAASILAVVLLAAVFLMVRHVPPGAEGIGQEHPVNGEMIRAAEKLVHVKVTPPFDFSFDLMKPGVLQHIDREYTYDIVPPELMNGFLFQGIHRPPKGTVIEFELKSRARVYFFFSCERDGGYTTIFARLKNWKRCAVFPQYDIHNGDHGLKMVMYQLDADAGTYSIPPTIEDKACFSMVFLGSDQDK